MLACPVAFASITASLNVWRCTGSFFVRPGAEHTLTVNDEVASALDKAMPNWRARIAQSLKRQNENLR
jgi:hypothetical protein